MRAMTPIARSPGYRRSGATWNANLERLSDGHVDEGVGDGEGATMGIQARIKAPKAYAAIR